MWEVAPFVVVGVEDEEVIQVPSIHIDPPKHDQIVVEGVHGVSVPLARPESLGLDLHPAQFTHFFKVDLPYIVEVQTASHTSYFSTAL